LPVDKAVAPNLKWIHLMSAGANGLPENILNSDIIVTNSSGVHPIPIAEHVFTFILMFSRKIDKTFRTQIKEETWKRDRAGGQDELFGKTMTIVGMGQIGSRVAELGKAFGMKTLGIVRNPNRKEDGVDKIGGIGDIREFLKVSDFVVDCLPATPETKGLFDLKMFKKFKKGSFFVNIGRGDTVVEKDLIAALKTGLIAGAGLDVFEVEPLPDSSPLWKMDNVIITPHSSGWSPKYIDRMIEIFCKNLEAYLKKKPMPNLVDKKPGY
jgi:D-2-hydroxyacid dehydrogenase (NADP+)